MKKSENTSLTKSRFKLGCECPAKLFYANNPEVYFDAVGEDSFIKALAEGGYQVGEYARWMLCNDPVNDLIDTLDKSTALAETANRLSAKNATVAEAAFASGDLFIRADVVVKSGNLLKLYEVKSKSLDIEESFWTLKMPRRLKAKWEPYLLDIAFQAYVIQKAYPSYEVQSHLALLDKGKIATVDGLATMFPVRREGRSVTVENRFSNKAELGSDLLAYVNVDDDIAEIHSLGFDLPDGGTGTFTDLIGQLSTINTSGERFICGVGAKCKKCQFHFPADSASVSARMKDGREECWMRVAGKDYMPGKPKVIELWNYRKTDMVVESGRFFIEDLQGEDLGDGETRSRQLLQINKVKERDETPWFDEESLRRHMSSWKFPLHFIDFETSRMALPTQKGFEPYSQVAFQFSHHTVEMNGTVRHAGQWIETGSGVFPSFQFVRELKAQLKNDQGTIFRYSNHENTVLREIRDQLDVSTESDRQDLIRWIDTITEYKTEDKKQKVAGSRNMVDLLEVYKACHYDPFTHGSNSLKHVLPAIIRASAKLRERYAQPIARIGLKSLNMPVDWIWLPSGGAVDPYKTLGPIFDAEEELELSEYVESLDDIDDGGAAMIAYGKLQFCDVPDIERSKIGKALLRYCELDTLAMVMLYQYWQEVVRR